MGVIDIGEWPYYTLATFALVNTAISAYYYLRIAKTMYFEKSDVDDAVETPVLGRVVVLGMVILTFYLFFMATELLTTTLNLELHL